MRGKVLAGLDQMPIPTRGLLLGRLVGICSILVAGCGPSPQPSEPTVAASKESAVSTSSAAIGKTGPENVSAAPVPCPHFVQVEHDLGVDFTYNRGDTPWLWPVEPTGGGAGWLDYDLDGRLDLLLVDGGPLPLDDKRSFQSVRLWRHTASGPFQDVTQLAGVWANDYGQGCTVGDYDADGFPDLFASNYGPCRLFRNHGDGTFEDVTATACVVGGAWNTGALFADFDRDGVLDLYVADYFHFDATPDYVACRSPLGERVYCGPMHSRPLEDFLYRGLGDGTFANATGTFGDPVPAGHSFGGVAADLDDDGWPDLYVVNDAMPNFLFHNLTGNEPGQDLAFEEVATSWGLALNGTGTPQASMGVCCGDVDGDQQLDLFLTHFAQEHTTLYLNVGAGDFFDASFQMKLGGITMASMAWGTCFLDLGNDGWLDLFTACGHLLRSLGGKQPYAMHPQLFLNREGREFEEIGRWAGPYFEKLWVGRGVAMGDINDDGRHDLAIVHHHKPMVILENQTPAGNAVTLELIGAQSNRDALNARLTFKAATKGDDQDARSSQPLPTRMHEIVSGGSFMSSNARQVIVGLGKAKALEDCQIRWPSGRLDTLEPLEAGWYYLVVESIDDRPPRVYRLRKHAPHTQSVQAGKS